jgi:hypothetical protein
VLSIPFLAQLLVQVPVYLVWLAGIVLAINYRHRYPRASLFTLIALLIFFVRSIIGTFLSIWLPLMLHSRGLNASGIGVLLLGNNVISALVAALAWGLLIAAIFSRRKDEGSRTT